jgi:hypothetical protein
MLFDTLCDLCESHLPELLPLLQDATLIRMDIRAHKELDRQIPPDDMIDLSRDFQLPSPVVVVEDTGSCVLLGDPDPNLAGLFQRRLVIDCMPMAGADMDNYGDGAKVAGQVHPDRYPSGTSIVTAGELLPSRHLIDTWNVGCRPMILFAGNKDRPVFGPFRGEEIPSALTHELMMSLSKNAITAVEELISLRRGNWAITVELPSSLPQTPKVPRSWEREVIVPIKHGLVEQLFGASATRQQDGKTVQLIRRAKEQN